MLVRFNIFLIVFTVVSSSQLCSIQAQDKVERLHEKHLHRIEERATNRLAERAQHKAQQKVLRNSLHKTEKFEASTGRLQQRHGNNQFIPNKEDSLQANELIRDIKHSKKDPDRRRKMINTVRNEFALTVLNKNGKDMVVRHGEIIALNISKKGNLVVEKLKLNKIRSFKLTTIGSTVDIFTVDEQSDFAVIIEQLNQYDPDGHYEYNQVYTASSGQVEKTLPRNEDNKIDDSEFTVGLIDTGVNENHISLKDTKVHQENFGRGKTVTPRNHGTAISSIIASHGRANVLVADVFSGATGFGDTEAIIRALDWLAGSDIGVINMSLAGPDNFILRHTISSLTLKGHIIVAAVGNEGPDGSKRFPAGYDHVVGVTAVDAKNNIYNKANQGSYVDIAAPGVDVIASAINGEKKYSGTSFAAPFVSALLAHRYRKSDFKSAQEILQKIMSNLTDLGDIGYDPVFGFGLLESRKFYKMEIATDVID
ncbi:MAG: S8 family serine peptidase [Gammaproteobacteria bacterium]|nr:S8 family serine peptidase [Gammaproteobacteria bacterium]